MEGGGEGAPTGEQAPLLSVRGQPAPCLGPPPEPAVSASFPPARPRRSVEGSRQRGPASRRRQWAIAPRTADHFSWHSQVGELNRGLGTEARRLGPCIQTPPDGTELVRQLHWAPAGPPPPSESGHSIDAAQGQRGAPATSKRTPSIEQAHQGAQPWMPMAVRAARAKLARWLLDGERDVHWVNGQRDAIGVPLCSPQPRRPPHVDRARPRPLAEERQAAEGPGAASAILSSSPA